jgi:hypothetical protein
MAWRRGFVDRNEGDPMAHAPTSNAEFISEKGGNDAPATYQDASGAPVEHDSPLGYSVGPVTITLLNITMMIGAGIYSTRMCSRLLVEHSLITYTESSLFHLGRNWVGGSHVRLLDTWVFGKSQWPRSKNPTTRDND